MLRFATAFFTLSLFLYSTQPVLAQTKVSSTAIAPTGSSSTTLTNTATKTLTAPSTSTTTSVTAPTTVLAPASAPSSPVKAPSVGVPTAITPTLNAVKPAISPFGAVKMGPDLEIHKPLQIRDCSYRGKPGKAVLIMFKNNGSAAAENARAELSSAGGAPETLALGSVPAKQGFGQPKQIGPCFDKDARISVKLIAQNDTNSMNNEAGANIVVGGKTSPVAIANPGAVMNTASPGIKNSIGISPIASPPTTVVDPTRGPNALSASGLSVDLGVCLYHGLTGNISRCANKLSDAKVRLTNITNQPITFVNASGTPSSLHLVAGEALVEPFFIVGPGHDKKVLNPGESDEFYYDARGAAGGVGTLSVAGNIYFKVGNGSQIFSKKISRSLNKVKQGYLDWYDVAGPIAFNVAPSQSQTKTVTIKNFGNTGSIVSTQVVPADPRIVVLQSCTGPLSGNSQCTISIRFDQSANPTPYAGKLRVSMDQGHPYVSFSTTMDIEKDLFGYINCPNGGTAGTGGCQ